MKQRIISAIVLILIFVPLLIIGKEPFMLLMILLSLLSLYELLKVREKRKKFPVIMKYIAYLLVMFFTFYNYNEVELSFYVDYRIVSLMLFTYIIPMVFINDNKKYNINDALFLIGSTVFIGLSFRLLLLIRNISLHYIIYMFGIATLTDTFALLVGRKIGKNKLAPLISPNKTIEGSVGGSLVATIVCSTYFYEVINYSMGLDINLGVVVIITLILSILGQIGDLIFSSIKRYYDIKDFSNLIPGHGGILDRLDSIIFVVLGFTLFISLL